MVKRLLIAGLTGYFYGRAAADARQRVNVFASLALQEAEGGRTLERIRQAKAAEIPAWLDELMQRHIRDEERHAVIFRRAVAAEKMSIDAESPAAVQASASVGEGSIKRFHKSEDLAAIALTDLLAGILIAEEGGVRAFRSLIRTIPVQLSKTRAGLESVLADEERHVRYLTDTLRTLGASRNAERMRRRIENQVFDDFGKIVEHLLSRKERPVLVKAGVDTEVAGEAL
ncbi:hypothetical protein [Gloeobacter violaceus]|uniref:Gll2861 protein n=1 Tax=Gloeobacter violaceus (strain ATCC 29082 / PCC 7421) TaxID=251221 RepID=Q7NCW5_GLOVI|nr:hypothetical protein [Gloeobacter violaceus]BAC90802.1 gll2861 [Gloeobacter violaceus PCC 7421]